MRDTDSTTRTASAPSAGAAARERVLARLPNLSALAGLVLTFWCGGVVAYAAAPAAGSWGARIAHLAMQSESPEVPRSNEPRDKESPKSAPPDTARPVSGEQTGQPVSRRRGVLYQVVYKHAGKEKVGTGELDYGTRQVRLRLFNDKLGTFYTVSLTYEDLLATTRLPRGEVERIWDRRDSILQAKAEQRERAKRERKARKAVAAKAGDDSAKGRRASSKDRDRTQRRRSGGATQKRSLPQRKRVPYVASAAETVGDAAAHIQELVVALESLEAGAAAHLKRIKPALDSPHRLSETGSLHRELLGAQEQLQELRVLLRRRQVDLEEMQAEVAAQELSAKNAAARCEMLYRRLGKFNKGLAKMQALQSKLARRLASGLQLQGQADSFAQRRAVADQSDPKQSGGAGGRAANVAAGRSSLSAQPGKHDPSAEELARADVGRGPASAVVHQPQAATTGVRSAPPTSAGMLEELTAAQSRRDPGLLENSEAEVSAAAESALRWIVALGSLVLAAAMMVVILRMR